MIRVVILADTPARAQALAKLLSDDERLEIIGVFNASPSRALEQSRIADVLVAIAPRSNDLPDDGPPVIVLADELPPEMPLKGFIRAWLPGNASPMEIAAAIIAAACDLTCLTPAQTRRWLRAGPAHHDDEEPVIETLTPRELQVLLMLANGLGNKEIAAQLGISDHTAKFHVAQILAKLGAGSRAEAVAIGMRRGLVPI